MKLNIVFAAFFLCQVEGLNCQPKSFTCTSRTFQQFRKALFLILSERKCVWWVQICRCLVTAMCNFSIVALHALTKQYFLFACMCQILVTMYAIIFLSLLDKDDERERAIKKKIKSNSHSGDCI